MPYLFLFTNALHVINWWGVGTLLKRIKDDPDLTAVVDRTNVRIELYGKEMVEKTVRISGNSGRVYLPPLWAGCLVKIVRVD